MKRTAETTARVLLGVLLFAGVVHADALNVSGAITDQETGNPIEGAVVSVTFRVGMGSQSVFDTTGADGLYEINTTLAGGGIGGQSFITIGAYAAGYIDGSEIVAVTNPNDGTPDTIVQDLALQPGETPAGDSLYVSGTVTNWEGAPLAGATVTVSLANLAGTQTANATTDSAGNYVVAMVNEHSSRQGIVEAIADGHSADHWNLNIRNPSDGNPDRYTHDFVLDAAVSDTLVVMGRALDSLSSSPLEGAWALITYPSGGLTGTTVTDSLRTGSDGRFVYSKVLTQMPMSIQWTLRAAGYAEKSGTEGVQDDTADIGTIDLVEDTSSAVLPQHALMPVEEVGGSVSVYSLDGRLLLRSSTVPAPAAMRRLNALRRSGQALIVRRAKEAAVDTRVLLMTR